MAMPVQNLSKLVKLVTINIRRTYTMSQSTAFHGSDLEQVAQYYHLLQEEIICFSANVNPLGFPAKTAGLVCQNFFPPDDSLSGPGVYRSETGNR